MSETVLMAPLVLEYPFTRTTGPIVGAFLTGLREQVVIGVRRADGTVMCPPLEYDPVDGSPLDELVEVGLAGEVVTWTWNGPPRDQQPFDRSFAWAMIKLDGADTTMLHAVLVDSPQQMSTGMRVAIRWSDEREGHIHDIAGFVPEPANASEGDGAADTTGLATVKAAEPVQSVRTPIRIEYDYTPGAGLSAYLRAIKDKRILGDKCPVSGQVFVPPRGVSPVAGVRTTELVELPDTGYIESFNITRVPIRGRDDLHPPYCSAWIVLDGASVGFIGLVSGVDAADVRIGMRVKAHWKPDDELEMSATNILWWEPTGEPDVEITDYEIVGRTDSGANTADTDSSANTEEPGAES